ncbi:hypothetical protein, partial [Staphylococcus epidermidis]|uniref:hypothetical protein n=1 Tax=Staphylococcus epidermidis TaxID=1282 RepID=UPI001C92F28B
LNPHPPTAKRKLFAAFPTLIPFAHIYIEKKRMRLCLRLFFDIWLAFCRGFWGLAPNKQASSHE